MNLPHRAESPFRPKLNLDTAVRMRRLYAEGASPSALATVYNVAKSSLRDVLKGHSHVCSVTIKFSDPVYVKLRSMADAHGCSVNDVVIRAVRRGLSVSGQ